MCRTLLGAERGKGGQDYHWWFGGHRESYVVLFEVVPSASVPSAVQTSALYSIGVFLTLRPRNCGLLPCAVAVSRYAVHHFAERNLVSRYTRSRQMTRCVCNGWHSSHARTGCPTVPPILLLCAASTSHPRSSKPMSKPDI